MLETSGLERVEGPITLTGYTPLFCKMLASGRCRYFIFIFMDDPIPPFPDKCNGIQIAVEHHEIAFFGLIRFGAGHDAAARVVLGGELWIDTPGMSATAS